MQFCKPSGLIRDLKTWKSEINVLPKRSELNSTTIYYPRYTSLPRQIAHGTWGFSAYPFLKKLLSDLHHQQPFDLIHAHYASPNGVIALLAKRWMEIPVVVSVHGADVNFTAQQNRVSRKVIQWVFEQSDYILANSSWTAGKIEKFGGKAEKIEIIHQAGTPPLEFVKPLHRETGNHSIKLLSVGYLYKSKGHEFAIKAAKRLIDDGYSIHYIIIGDGNELSNLKDLVRSLGIEDAVVFLGAKPQNEVWQYYSESDIFLLPSYVEGFGLVFLEALSMGIPAIGCEGTGGPEDINQLGDCMYLVKQRDVDSIVQALKELIDDPVLRKKMGEEGRRIAAENFSWSGMAAKTYDVYSRLLSTGSLKRRGKGRN
jgi:teichuronic acid biosynthesis glycosyltransferase TuaC